MLEHIKKFKRVLANKDFYMNTTTSCNCKKFGSDYGGWYLDTDSLNKDDIIIFSFGLGEDISFDLEMIKAFNCRVYGFDPTPKSIEYIESLNLDSHFILNKYALSDTNGSQIFNLPAIDSHVSGSLEEITSNDHIEVESKTLKKIMSQLSITKIDILKMDIEGSEYKVIQNMINDNIFPEQILIEYHHFFKKIKNIETKVSIRSLLDNGYELFYIDGYNYSFIRKDCI